MRPENLTEVQAELTAAGLMQSDAAAVRIVESGWFAGLPYLTTATGDVAIETWRRLRSVCYSRRHPVLVDEAEDRSASAPASPSFPGVTDVVAEGWRMDLRDQWRRLLAAELDRLHVPGDKSPPRSEMTEMHGEWPTRAIARHGFVGPHWGNRTAHPTADILLPACPEPWTVPAYLRAQTHNDLPDAAVQCAVLRSWYRRFGAEVVYTNGVVYEFAVGRPPRDRNTAMELAREHYLFCPDRLIQACPDSLLFPTPNGTLESLAAMLIESSVWYFWWD